jgi:hypothetical protein
MNCIRNIKSYKEKIIGRSQERLVIEVTSNKNKEK